MSFEYSASLATKFAVLPTRFPGLLGLFIGITIPERNIQIVSQLLFDEIERRGILRCRICCDVNLPI